MNPIRAIGTFLAPALVAGLAFGFAAQREARIKAETEHMALEQQLKTLARIADENAQLSNLVASATASKPLSSDELRELLRLRAEVSALRQQTAALESV